jgi:hypothetical protein
MRLERQVEYTGKRIGEYKVWWGYLTESSHLEDFGVDIRITYKRIFKKQGGRSGLD